MERTQIYLTSSQRKNLKALAKKQGVASSDLIRQAIDRFLEGSVNQGLQDTLEKVAGIWKDRNDLPNFSEIRKSLDRN